MAAADPSLEQSLIGAVLSRRYRLQQELGRGGMGAVYSAEQLEGGAIVAIKILHAHFMGDVPVLQRFMEEGRTCMRLTHPNILHVHECNTAEDGSPYLVMDLLEGVPLSAYTRNGGRVSTAHAIPILHGMLAGLEAAHNQGVVHRDLKPGNVFLAREPGGLFTVKLLDFGIAKVMDVAGGMGNKTKTGMLLGTPAYMSPEQIKSAKDVDSRADLWSAGVMFYEMLTGRTAFPAPTEYARLSAVLQSNPEPIETVDPELAPLAPFLAKALQKDPAARYQTARDMSLALHAASLIDRRSVPGEPNSRVVVAPLSRLPDRAWVEGSAVASLVPSGGPPSGVPSRPLTPAPGSAPPAAAVDEQGATHFEPVAPKSSTLASAGLSMSTTPPPGFASGAPMVARASGAPPAIVKDGGAAPAKVEPVARRGGVRGWVVLLLVLVSLGAGLCGGIVLAHYYVFDLWK
jgi:eukaryotic-like serine/threonine-protein kinase